MCCIADYFTYRSRTINFEKYVKFLEDLAEQKNLNAEDLKEKLADCGLPGTTNVSVHFN